MKFELLEKSVPSRITESELTHHARAKARNEDWQWYKDAPTTFSNWAHPGTFISNRRLAEWTIECAVVGAALMGECVNADPDIRGGRLVLKGTGFTVAQLLAEIASTPGVDDVADDFDLDPDAVRKFLGGLSLLFERSWAK